MQDDQWAQLFFTPTERKYHLILQAPEAEYSWEKVLLGVDVTAAAT